VASEDDKERIDRELTELLEEVRVAIPGAEVLFAFLLGVAFTERFQEVTSTQRAVYFATLLLTAAATGLLIAPTAYHRLRFRDGDKERLLFSATRMVVTSLALLLFAVAGVVYLVGDVLYESKVAGIAGALTAAWFVWFWFGLPLTRRVADDTS
jgi:predicted membrane channel-forming protein YqfA (hemolysin III family)